MSIIQEALKRKEEEQAAANTPGQKITPGATGPPNSAEQPSSNPPKEKKGNPWRTLLLVLLMLAVVGGAGIYLFHAGLKGFLGDEKEGQSGGDIAAQKSEDPEESGVAPSKEPESEAGLIVKTVKESIEKAKERVDAGASEADGEETSSNGESKATDRDEKGEAAEESESKTDDSPEPQAQELEGATSKKEEIEEEEQVDSAFQEDEEQEEDTGSEDAVQWPKIEVKGIMAPSGGNRGTVLLGNKMLAVGNSYKGAKVVKISRTSVLLELDGEKRLLGTGQTVGVE